MLLLADGELNWLGPLPPFLQLLISVAVGASVVGIPLYAKIRQMTQDIKMGAIEIANKEADVEAKEAVNQDAEFRRILDYRNDEIKRLNDRDEAQEKKIADLYIQLLEYAKNEARQDERSKMQTEKISNLERKVMLLEMLLHEKSGSQSTPTNVTINAGTTVEAKETKEAHPPETPPTLIVPAS